MLSGQAEGTEHERSSCADEVDEDDGGPVSRGRPHRTALKAKPRPGKHIDGYNELDEMDDESDAPSSGNEWDSGAEDEPDDQADEDDHDDGEMSDDDNDIIAHEEESEDEDDQRSRGLLVSLRYSKTGSSPLSEEATNGATALKQEDTPATPKPYQTDPTNAARDTSNAVQPAAPNEPSKQAQAQDPSKHLHLTYQPTTHLPSVSADPFKESIRKTPITPVEAPAPQPPLDASLQATSASLPEMLGNRHPQISSQELQPPKVEIPSINFQQYQYHPPAQ